MLTVITPATSTRLTTLSRARALLGFATTDDPAASVCVDQASRAIADYCRRPFGLETVRETFRGCETSRDGFLLSRSPVVGALVVTGDEAVLATTDYQYDPSTGRLYRTDGTLSGYRYPWSWGVGLAVDYSAGYVLPSEATGAPAPTLPEPVERAAILIAGAYLSIRQRDPLIKSEDIAGIGSTSWWVPSAASGLPSPEAEQLLQPYRRLYP